MHAREGAVIDTHVLLWMFDGSLPTRSQSAASAVAHALTAGALHISIGSFLDLRYLVDSGHRPEEVFDNAESVVAQYEIAVVPCDLSVLDAMSEVPKDAVADPFDRIIAATAISLNLPLVTADRAIQKTLGERAIW